MATLHFLEPSLPSPGPTVPCCTPAVPCSTPLLPCLRPTIGKRFGLLIVCKCGLGPCKRAATAFKWQDPSWVGMKGKQMEHTIPAPPSAVFAVLAEQGSEWMPAVKSNEKLSNGPVAKGSKWIETRETPRGPFVATVEVTECEPGKSFAIRSGNRKAEWSVRFNLEAAGEGTKVTSNATGRTKGPLFFFSRGLVKDLNATHSELLPRLEAEVAKRQALSEDSVSPVTPAGAGSKAAKTAKATRGTRAKASKATNTSSTTNGTPAKKTTKATKATNSGKGSKPSRKA